MVAGPTWWSCTPAWERGALALAVFVLHLLGDTLAAPLFGKIIDTQGISRQQTFLYFSGAIVLAGLCCLVAAGTARRDTARVAPRVEEEATV